MAHIEDTWKRQTGRVNGRGQKEMDWIPTRDTEAKRRVAKDLRFKAVYTEADGQRRSPKFATEPEAVAFLAKMNVARVNGKMIKKHDMTVAEFGDQWYETYSKGVRPTTATIIGVKWRNHIRPVLGPMRLLDVKIEHIQALVDSWTENGVSPSTQVMHYGYLKLIFRTAAARKLIPESPCTPEIRRAKNDSEPFVPLTREQVSMIANRIRPSFRGLVLLGAATGMRAGELFGLREDSIDWHADGTATIKVHQQWHRSRMANVKTKASRRFIKIDKANADELRTHLEKFPPTANGFVFTGARGNPMSRSTSADVFNKATEGMGLPPRTNWHALRHFHASMLLSAGVPIPVVSARLGHENSKITMGIYAHLMKGDEDRALAALAAQAPWTPAPMASDVSLNAQPGAILAP